MIYSESFQKHHEEILHVLSACARMHEDPMIYVELSGEIVGCNPQMQNLFHAESITEIPPAEEWFEPQGVAFSFLISNSGHYRGILRLAESEHYVSVHSEILMLNEEPVVGIVFKDTSVIERAKAAERYFEQFKKKFLTNISHEFRTPMNAIIGFTDLLKNSPLSSWQKEYAEMASSSAMSMMRNIENMLELMQVESGAIQAHFSPYHPLDVYENFSRQFNDLAKAKNIDLMFLIDPHLPKSIIGDQDKILAILRNLVQNGVKFTPEKGRVLVEILISRTMENFIEVEYAVSDTGVGIEPEQVKTILRPFASAWSNQRRGKDGLGIGLSLSQKYVDMMDSHLMLASEIGKGSRFSFRISHEVFEQGSFEFVSGTKAAIYSGDDLLSAQGALLGRYLEFFGVQTTMIESLLSKNLLQTDLLFIDSPYLSKIQIDSLKSTYPDLHIVPILELDYGDRAEALIDVVDSIVTLPILPSSLHKTLAVVWNKMPKEYIANSIDAQVVASKSKIKILVAEDNLINLRLLETILKQNEYMVCAVDNGQKAVDAYLKEPFDLVLMDIDMPVMDGLTANRLIKEIDKKDKRGYTPVIALTAHALVGDRERIIAAGLDAHLAKPIDKHFLLQTIERFLIIAEQNRHNQKAV